MTAENISDARDDLAAYAPDVVITCPARHRGTVEDYAHAMLAGLDYVVVDQDRRTVEVTGLWSSVSGIVRALERAGLVVTLGEVPA